MRDSLFFTGRPSVPAIQTVAHDFPWFEGQRGELECTTPNAGNPASLVTWIDDSGKIPNQQHYIIGNLSFFEHRRSVKCQLENEFTREKNERVESHVITLNVQCKYDSKVQTL